MIGALTLSAARRRREEALLRTLGLSGGQPLWLTVVEHAPSVLLAVLPGLALGIGIACCWRRDGTVRLCRRWDAGPAHRLVVGLVSLGSLVVALAIGIGTYGRARAADALRFGED